MFFASIPSKAHLGGVRWKASRPTIFLTPEIHADSTLALIVEVVSREPTWPDVFPIAA